MGSWIGNLRIGSARLARTRIIPSPTAMYIVPDGSFEAYEATYDLRPACRSPGIHTGLNAPGPACITDTLKPPAKTWSGPSLEPGTIARKFSETFALIDAPSLKRTRLVSGRITSRSLLVVVISAKRSPFDVIPPDLAQLKLPPSMGVPP